MLMEQNKNRRGSLLKNEIIIYSSESSSLSVLSSSSVLSGCTKTSPEHSSMFLAHNNEINMVYQNIINSKLESLKKKDKKKRFNFFNKFQVKLNRSKSKQDGLNMSRPGSPDLDIAIHGKYDIV